MSPDWQQRRSAFNHDWLKNRFQVDFGSFLNILDDRVDDPGLEQRFVRRVLPQWPERAAEAKALIADFESAMSPRAMFRVPPLSHCSAVIMAWLPDLVHVLWLHRYGVRALCDAAEEALAGADKAYRGLSDALRGCPDVASAFELRPYRPQFAALRAACEKVSSAISRFSNKGLVA